MPRQRQADVVARLVPVRLFAAVTVPHRAAAAVGPGHRARVGGPPLSNARRADDVDAVRREAINREAADLVVGRAPTRLLAARRWSRAAVAPLPQVDRAGVDDTGVVPCGNRTRSCRWPERHATRCRRSRSGRRADEAVAASNRSDCASGAVAPRHRARRAFDAPPLSHPSETHDVVAVRQRLTLPADVRRRSNPYEAVGDVLTMPVVPVVPLPQTARADVGGRRTVVTPTG